MWVAGTQREWRSRCLTGRRTAVVRTDGQCAVNDYRLRLRLALRRVRVEAWCSKLLHTHRGVLRKHREHLSQVGGPVLALQREHAPHEARDRFGQTRHSALDRRKRPGGDDSEDLTEILTADGTTSAEAFVEDHAE